MSGWPRIYYKLLNLPLSILVKASLFRQILPGTGAGYLSSIMYVLPYNSKADLLTLRAQCLAHDLPDPLEPLEIDGTLLPRYVFIHGGPRVFTYYTPKEESIKLFHDYLDLHRSNPNLDVQMVPVSVMFGRAPGREKGEVNPPLRMLNGVQKFFAVLWLGRDSFVRFRRQFLCAAWPMNTAQIKLSLRNWRAWRVCTLPVNVWLLWAHVCLLVRICLISCSPPAPLPKR